MRILYLFVIILLSSFNARSQKYFTQTVWIGQKQINIPIEKNQVNCYLNDETKAFADAMDNSKLNKTLLLIMDREDCDRRTSFGTFKFDDFTKVYVQLSAENQEVNESQFMTISKKLKEAVSFETSWEHIEKEIEKNAAIQFQKPVLISMNTSENDVHSYYLLTSFKQNEVMSIMACAMNLHLTNGKLFITAHYISMDRKNAMEELKAKNKKFIKEFRKIN